MTSKKNAAFTELELGTTGKIVASNIARIRETQGISYNKLSGLLGDLENPIPSVGLRRIEAQARRVTVDDLAAIAVALNVSPMRLLMPASDIQNDFATGLPADFTFAEAEAWFRGETNLSIEARFQYWQGRAASASLELEALAKRLDDAVAHREKDPDNILVDKAVGWISVQIKKNEAMFKEASERAELLQLEITQNYEADLR